MFLISMTLFQVTTIDNHLKIDEMWRETADNMTQTTMAPSKPTEDLTIYIRMANFGVGLHIYLMPCICVIGYVGNSLSFLVMMQKNNRALSSCNYMASLAFTDNGILAIIGYYVYTFVFDDPMNQVICSLLAYLVFVTTLMGSLTVVAMTFDRFIAITFPLKASTLCTPRRARITLGGLYIFAVVYNIPHLYLSRMVNERTCASFAVQSVFKDVYSWIGIVVSCLFPFTVLIILNILIIKSVKKSRSFFKSADGDGGTGDTEADKKRKDQDRQLTRMLLLVSFMLLALTFLQYLRNIVFSFVNPNASQKLYYTYIMIYHITNKLFFSNGAVNFFLYCISGTKFRNDLRNLLCCGRGTGLDDSKESQGTTNMTNLRSIGNGRA